MKATKLIRLKDGTLVEVEVKEGEPQQVSGGPVQKVAASLDVVLPVLAKVCRPIAATWDELNKDIEIEQAEVELGLSFEGEGNLFVTKAKAEANLSVKLIFRPKKT